MAVLVLVQHGEKKPFPGDPGLTPRGKAQAQRTALALAELGRPVAIYGSPLQRAAETGAAIGEHFGLDVHYDDQLRERISWYGEPIQSFESFVADWERSTRDRDFLPAFGDSSHNAARRLLAVSVTLPRPTLERWL